MPGSEAIVFEMPVTVPAYRGAMSRMLAQYEERQNEPKNCEVEESARLAAPRLVQGESVITCPSPLSVLKDT
jgi:hypothetical protein